MAPLVRTAMVLPAPALTLFTRGVVAIRCADANDAAAIARVLEVAFLEYRPFYTAQAFAATTPTSERILLRFHEGPLWIAQQDETIVGTVSARQDGDSIYIRGMAVLPEARGRHIGVALLRNVEHFAQRHHCRRLFLSTTPFLERATRLYERFGFRRTDDGPHDLFGTPLFTMEKLLAA
jgi:ribosomal protein S18 acetylase RimI-like enzyme